MKNKFKYVVYRVWSKVIISRHGSYDAARKAANTSAKGIADFSPGDAIGKTISRAGRR